VTDWPILIALGAFAVSVLTLVSKFLDKSLTIREHDEYRKGVERTTDGLQEQFWREFDKLESRLNFIDQTKPSSGQLQDATSNLKEQLAELKAKLNRELH